MTDPKIVLDLTSSDDDKSINNCSFLEIASFHSGGKYMSRISFISPLKSKATRMATINGKNNGNNDHCNVRK